MSFRIEFYGDELISCGLVVGEPRPARRGTVFVGDNYEDFYAPLDVWPQARYVEQWEDALRRLRRGLTSCFVISVHPPDIAQYIECWLVWRLESEYRVQNQCMFFDVVGQVDPADPYDAIWPYSNQTEDGERISDWGLPLDTFDR